MSVYFLADAKIFGVLWLIIILRSMQRNGWTLPYTYDTFDRDYFESEELIQRFSLFRFYLSELSIYGILMGIPMFYFFLDMGGVLLAIFTLKMSFWVKVCASIIACLTFIESLRCAKLFSFFICGHLQGRRIKVMRRYCLMFGHKNFWGGISYFGKIFMAIEIVLWT